MSKILNPLLRFSCEILILVVFSFYCSTIINKSKVGSFNFHTPEVITGDGLGYYSYLPAIFIYNDLEYSFMEDIQSKYYPRGGVSDFINEFKGQIVNKYFLGLSILLLPFFLLAHFLSYLFGISPDGYSVIYQYSVVAACFFYLWMGLFFIKKLLSFYVTIPAISFAVLALTVFATNIYYYAMHEQSMTHVYSFALIAGFLFYAKSYFEKPGFHYLLKASFILGLIVLVRPVNGLIVLILPFLAGSFVILKIRGGLLIKEYKPLLASAVLFVFIVVLQFLIWHLQTGHFVVWSYGEEGFNFFEPNIFNVLFSYRKGLFVYTPLAFISLLGFITLYKISKFSFSMLFIFLFVLTYIISSWWAWDYGMSFGLRPFIDFYPILSLLLAHAFLFFDKIFSRISLLLVCMGALFVNFVQTDQYVRYVIHGNQMNKERYWEIFLKTSNEYEGIFYKEIQPENLVTFEGFYTLNDFEKEYAFWRGNTSAISTEISHSGENSAVIDNYNQYSHTYKRAIIDSLASPKNRLKVSVWYYLTEKAAGELVVAFDSEGSCYKRSSEKLLKFSKEEKRWQEMVIVQQFPEGIKAGDELVIFVWNTGESEIYIDDFKVELLRQAD